MLKLPKIFEFNEVPEVQTSELMVDSDHHWIEFIAHLSRVKQAVLPDTREQIELLLQENQPPRKRAVLYAGLARYQKAKGNLLKSTKLLGYAFSLLTDNKEDDEARAFITIEMSVILTLTGNIDYSTILLEKVPLFTQTEYLLRNSEFRIMENRMRQNDPSVLEDLKKSLNYFKDISMHHIVAYHLKAIGNAHRRFRDYDQAMAYYRQGMEYASSHGLMHIVAAVMHDIGMLEFHRGNIAEAHENLSNVMTLTDNHYIKSVALANIGYLYYYSEKTHKAIGFFQKSLDIATENGVYHRLPGLCHYLGKCYEQTQDYETAEFFHKKAYQSSMELIQYHFPSTGDILLAIRGYFDFTESYKDYKYQSKHSEQNAFSHTIDKSLKEIRKVFQHAVIKETILRTGSKRRAALELGVAERSLFSIMERVSDSEHEITPQEITRFIRKNKTLSWKAINQKYEQGVLTCLYKEYGLNKRVLAEKLQISYPSILNLTANIGKKIVKI